MAKTGDTPEAYAKDARNISSARGNRKLPPKLDICPRPKSTSIFEHSDPIVGPNTHGNSNLQIFAKSIVVKFLRVQLVAIFYNGGLTLQSDSAKFSRVRTSWYPDEPKLQTHQKSPPGKKAAFDAC